MKLAARLFVAALFLFITLSLRAADAGVAPDQAVFAPGKEVKILDPKTGRSPHVVRRDQNSTGHPSAVLKARSARLPVRSRSPPQTPVS